ncbi:hypothetical protein BDN71DRAFT_1468331 [Pleurotus eryngii]|uniref:Metal homeostatis protein bsd2 n=1 Tax=Pleurotus eryngii TaxID=5323 RepID=A0A9P6A222_PLEER|nr:hypothetical protein BDN71DRAFT_1468331 [Pleurotus eryngii]
MSARYAALPTQPSPSDAERDRMLDDAFGTEDDNESTPLTRQGHEGAHNSLVIHDESTGAIPGVYDFERDYDYPPPGSPPAPSEFARPNEIGNSNGLLPSSPVTAPRRRGGLFRRAVGALLPTHYSSLPTEEASRARGGGMENDGVFANVMAKPQPTRLVETEDGDMRLAPEDTQKEGPPSYTEAAADAVPPYWETTVHAPAELAAGDYMLIDDLPSGSFLVFVLNMFISFFFQFVGFLLTYLLHTSHAAKYGSRAGLGLTMIQLGLYSHVAHNEDSPEEGITALTGFTRGEESSPTVDESPMPVVSPRDWLSFFLMTMGWFILLSSSIGFWRVKRWETSIRAASQRSEPITPEDVARDVAIRRNLYSVFGFGVPEEDTRRGDPGVHAEDENGNVIVIPSQEALEEARLARDLRAAGLI